jgi:hypothetical protein
LGYRLPDSRSDGRQVRLATRQLNWSVNRSEGSEEMRVNESMRKFVHSEMMADYLQLELEG